MKKKELYKKAREYLGKTVSYGIGNIEFDYDRPDGKEYIYEESQDDEDMENFAVMDFLEDLLVDFIKQELDKAREEGRREQAELDRTLYGISFEHIKNADFEKILLESVDKAKENIIKDLIKKIEEAHCDSISLELLKEIDLSKLKSKEDGK